MNKVSPAKWEGGDKVGGERGERQSGRGEIKWEGRDKVGGEGGERQSGRGEIKG